MILMTSDREITVAMTTVPIIDADERSNGDVNPVKHNRNDMSQQTMR